MARPRDITPVDMVAFTATRVDLRDVRPVFAAGISPARPASPTMAVPPSSASATASAEPAVRFRRMVDEHFAVVWRFLRGLGVRPAGVDDAAQQVFLVASQRLDAITIGSERAFLFAAARGVAANVRRAQARSREVADDEALVRQVDDQANPEEALAARQARARLDALLETLPDDAREVFVLFELEGMTMAAIAEALSLPPGTVASRLRRAREEFHAAAKREQLRSERAGGRR
jgi:RNA polymerase sigma-70 factor (ECF subfamily)